MEALAIKYRPKTWEDVTEQTSVKIILQQQLNTNTVQHCYLFCGGAGTGKTTSARIFANEINKGQGNPIELDAASNNSVEDMRELIQQAKTKSLDSEYKVFIIDECHMITTQGWNAILKLIEEPPAKSIFLFCTTDPQKIPKTILSRVQRYDFQRISQQGIVDRLLYILSEENEIDDGERGISAEAVEYIAKIADGGMRDAITLLDKCLAYSTDLTLENVVKCIGTVDYSIMKSLTNCILQGKQAQMIEIVENIFNSGKDIKQFVKQYSQFLLDVCKYQVGCDWKFLNIPRLTEYETWLSELTEEDYDVCNELLETLIQLNTDIKYSSTPKYDLEAVLFLKGAYNDRAD